MRPSENADRLLRNSNQRKGLEEICQEGFSNHLQIFSIIVIVYSGNYHDEYDSNKQTGSSHGS